MKQLTTAILLMSTVVLSASAGTAGAAPGASTKARSSGFSRLRLAVRQARQLQGRLETVAQGSGAPAAAALKAQRLLAKAAQRDTKLNDWEFASLSGWVAKAKIPGQGLEMLTTLAYRSHWRPRLERALASYAEGEPTSSIAADPKTAALLTAIEGARIHALMGRKVLAAQARAQARHLADLWGVDINSALDAPRVYFQLSSSDRAKPTSASEVAPSGGRVGGIEYERIGPLSESYFYQGVDRLSLSGFESRRVSESGHWWSGHQTAYLDLMHRRLPELLVERFAKNPRQRKLRIWHAGYEEGSQTFLLAALLDTAISRLERENPAMRGFLEQLQVEIVATDISAVVTERGKTLRFMVDGCTAQTKRGLVAEELGLAERRKARAEVRKLRQRLRSATGQERKDLLEQLAHAGEIGLTMNRLLTLAPEVDADWTGPVFTHRLRDKRWRIDNHAAFAAVINPQAKDRSIRFEHGDLTRSHPTGRFDLVVCTNVLRWFHIYGANTCATGAVDASLKNIAAAMKAGGVALMDVDSELELLQRPAKLRDAFAKDGKKVWITRKSTVEPLLPSVDAVEQVREREVARAADQRRANAK